MATDGPPTHASPGGGPAGQGESGRGARRTLRRRFTVGLVFALAVYVALLVYGDLGLLRQSLRSFPWHWLPVILGLTLLNYAGRWLKWLWYLRLVGSPIGRGNASRIFGIGFTMVLTPGKVGEFLKSYMVRNAAGTPMRITAPIVVAERLTDGLAMLILAGVGLLGVPDPTLRRAALLLLAAMVGVVIAVWLRPVSTGLLRRLVDAPLVGPFALHARDAYDSSYRLLGPRNLLIAVGVGIVSWICEGLAYYLVLLGVSRSDPAGALPVAWETAAMAVFIFSASTLLGAAMATPGGLGAIEISLVALSERLLGLARAPATAGALLIRFATLWFGVAIGMVGLALWSRLLEPPSARASAGDG